MQCLKPFTKTDTQETFPCGKCPNCTARRVSGWSFRIMQQSKIADAAVFLTLTYSSKNVPLTPKGYMTLNKTQYETKITTNGKIKQKQISSHLQQFIKNLRKKQFGNAKSTLKYYACGEYGGKTNRPHYHMILFNAKIELIQHCWPHGSIHYGMDVNEASVGYTLKYMSKPSRIPMHKNDDRIPEYALMSKGIGSNYLTDAIKWWHNQSHEFMHCVLPDGKKIAMPRYYKQKIYDEFTRIMFGKLGFETMQKKKNDLLSKYNITAEEYDLRKEEQTNARYRQQIQQSNKRQNNSYHDIQ